ncbi:signal peptidase I [Paenibacillus shirakamiensis]|uniref:Signal peptidase I n=1 Tax=Paenibacillus shirakamiensis TaxID=1265935 RepID=A0ABS4JFD7_9BACL|nr:signal peptidase I [Paenibacillus shirakamiensis]MBP1999780.1 signal peptidase I [Paenibacillus shirakamiensis]
MRIAKEMLGYVYAIGIAFVISLFVGIFLFQPYKVDGKSMDPTLKDKQRIYASKLAHTFSHMPAYGDIVILDSRVDRKRSFMDSLKEHPIIQWIDGEDKEEIYFVKRVIGKPGDTIEIKNQHVYRNGVQLNESYINETMNTQGGGEWKVPADHVFVLGDNRNYSRDSREIGFIPLDHVLGIEQIK